MIFLSYHLHLVSNFGSIMSWQCISIPTIMPTLIGPYILDRIINYLYYY